VSHSSSSFFFFPTYSRTKLVLGSERFRWGVFFSPKKRHSFFVSKGPSDSGLYSFLFLNEENGNEPTPVPSHNRETERVCLYIACPRCFPFQILFRSIITWPDWLGFSLSLSLDVVYRPTLFSFSIWFYIKHWFAGAKAHVPTDPAKNDLKYIKRKSISSGGISCL
jgi:hypothetical protein